MTTKVSPNFIELTDEDLANPEYDRPTNVLVRGKKVLMESVRTVKLRDGRRVFKCDSCNYAAKKATSIPPHRKVHFTNGKLNTAPVKKTAARKTAKKSVTIQAPQVATPVSSNGSAPDGEVVVTNLQSFINARNTERDQLTARVAELEAALNTITRTTAAVL